MLDSNTLNDDDGVGSGGEKNVALRDTPHRPMDYSQLHFVARHPRQRVRDRFHGALDVGLEHQAKLFDIAGLDLVESSSSETL
jgi:hypothetical protein